MSQPFTNPSENALRTLLANARTVAVVGLSGRPGRAATYVSRYLHQAGYRLFPIHPQSDTVFDLPVHRRLADVPEPIDVVLVFRRSEDTPPIARDAAAAGAKVLWLQSGITHPDIPPIAENGGMTLVMDRCIMMDHQALLG
ncbi:MAG: CoA-binding protein [Sumerlaeia bacterium]